MRWIIILTAKAKQNKMDVYCKLQKHPCVLPDCQHILKNYIHADSQKHFWLYRMVSIFKFN